MTSLAADLLAALRDDGGAGGRLGPRVTLEHVLTAPDLANFAPSPAQLALVRAADGTHLDGIVSPDRMRFHFGVDELPATRPSIVIPRTGVRAGKSLIAALGLLTSILRADFANVRSGELVRALIVAPVLKVSGAPFHHLVGTMKASTVLAPMLVKDGAESCTIRRPDGREVTVQLVAASSGGLNLRSTWLAGVIFDEADFHEDEDGAVNLPDNLRAAMPRLLPGGQAWVPSSPWADTGPYHEMFTEAFGNPGRAVAFHSDSRSMNPTLSLEDEVAERERDPDNAAREYDAIPLSANSSNFFPDEVLVRAIDKGRPMFLEPIPGHRHFAGVDLGFRKNSSALAIARMQGAGVRLAYHEERRPELGKPLKPSMVVREFAEKCLDYGARSMRGDLHYADAAHEYLANVKRGDQRISYEEWAPTMEGQTEAFTAFRTLMAEGRCELPNDARLVTQMKRTTTRPLPGGKIKVILPKQGQSHGDVLMAVVLACVQAGAAPTRIDPPPKALPGGRWGSNRARGFG
ncbi:MAG: hypothetical protein WKG00_03220 [Polyangiaceae bacterium]